MMKEDPQKDRQAKPVESTSIVATCPVVELISCTHVHGTIAPDAAGVVEIW
jgi:hypothetical protein